MPGDNLNAAFVDFDFKTLTEMLEKTCQYHANNPLFGIRKGKEPSFSWLSYHDFHEIVAKTRTVLWQQGIRTNDKVALISDNRWEWAAIAYATMELGAQVVPM
jgi:long-chain acyl-CoA synthetase